MVSATKKFPEHTVDLDCQNPQILGFRKNKTDCSWGYYIYKLKHFKGLRIEKLFQLLDEFGISDKPY